MSDSPNQIETGASEAVAAQSQTGDAVITLPAGYSNTNTQGDLGARHVARYFDNVEEYVPVTRNNLREIANFGLLEKGTGAAGMFFLSGAFWLGATLLAEHGLSDFSKFSAAYGLCGISVIFGAILIWVARAHSKMREDRVNDYFRPKT